MRVGLKLGAAGVDLFLAGAVAGGVRVERVFPTVVPRTEDVVGFRAGAAGGPAPVACGAVVGTGREVVLVPEAAPVVALLPTPVPAGSSRAETSAATSGLFEVS